MAKRKAKAEAAGAALVLSTAAELTQDCADANVACTLARGVLELMVSHLQCGALIERDTLENNLYAAIALIEQAEKFLDSPDQEGRHGRLLERQREEVIYGQA